MTKDSRNYNKELDKQHNRLMKALLASGQCLEDVFKVKESERTSKGNKPLVHALKRHVIETSRNGEGSKFNVTKRVVKAGDMIPVGNQYFLYEDLLGLFNRYDKYTTTRRLNVPLRLSLYDIEQKLPLIGLPNWGKLDLDVKESLLFSLGMDCREPNKFYIDRVQYRSETTNKLEYGLVVIGEERVDKEWRDSGYASQEAILYTEDLNLRKDLAEMGRY